MSEMTATRMGRWSGAVLLILLIAAWVVGGTRLWHTSVPSTLHVGGLDVHRYFTPAQLAASHRYWRFVEIDWALAAVASIAALVVLALRAPRLARGIGLGPYGSGVVIAMVTLVTLRLVSLPFAFAQQWWAARHGLAPHDYLAWLFAQRATLGFDAVYALGAIVLLMWLARRLGAYWWLAAAPVYVGLALLFAFLSGWIAAAGTHPPKAMLRADAARLERVERVDAPVRVQKVSSYTHEINAFTVGLGASTHVVVWNTLLDGRLSRAEVDVVLAHELGHVAHKHIWKDIGWLALIAFPLAWIVAAATQRAGGLGSPGTIPLALLVLTVVSLAAAPLQNAVSRRYESEADWSALRATRDPTAAAKLFASFERTSLEEPSPPAWDYWLLENHPTLAQRIAMATRWRAVSARRRAGAPRAGS
jgi:STE24 endopeptidase